jgi:hypothetical protein
VGRSANTFATATRACQAFAAAEPDLVDLYLRDWEDRLRVLILGVSIEVRTAYLLCMDGLTVMLLNVVSTNSR